MNLKDRASDSESTPKRIPQLDGLRGIAILLVIAWHYFACIPVANPGTTLNWFRRLFQCSWSGVDLFFVLSGFLIGGILIDNKQSPKYFSTFYIRRAYRILPLYFLLILSFYATSLSLEIGDDAALKALLENSVPTWSYFVFFQNFFMMFTETFGPQWVGITWSLAIEEQFYLLFPLVLFVIPKKVVPFVCLILVITAPALRCYFVLVQNSTFSPFYLLPARMDGLLLGVIGAWMIRKEQIRDALTENVGFLYAMFIVLAVGIAIFSYKEIDVSQTLMLSFGLSWIAFFYFSLLLICLVTKNRIILGIFCFKPLRAIGFISYFIYLFHQLINHVTHYLLFGTEPYYSNIKDVSATIVAFAATLLIGAISWQFLERPFIRHGRQHPY